MIGFLAVLFTNCKIDSQLELKFDEIRYVYKDECKQDQCAEVNIEYIKSVGGLKVSEKINNTINEYIISERIICLEMKQYLYTGGAHGYGSTWYLNINRKSGEELSINDILNNEDSFKNYAEKVFREKLLIPEGGSINATGFWFDDDTFYLPETIGFQDSNVILLYNPDGPIEIVIPIADIESYLKAK